MKKFFVSRLVAVLFASTAALFLAACGGGGGSSGAGGAGGAGGGGCTAAVPGAPSIASVAPGNASATVYWFPPSLTAPAGYTITSSPGNITANVPGTSVSGTVTGLTNGTAYTFTVKAYTCAGTGPASAASTPVTPVGPPGAPTNVSATTTSAIATASIGFTAPANTGGGTITSYTVTSSPGNIKATGTASPILVSGLSNNTTYTFTVAAMTSGGMGPSSTASNSVLVSIAYAGPFYVNASTGLDTNNGSSGTPFKTITQSLYVAKAVGTPNTVNVASGTYASETFPLMMLNGVNLVGTSGSAVTAVNGIGYYTTTTGHIYGAALVFPPAVTSTVSGFTIEGGSMVEVIADGATATLVGNNINGPMNIADGMYAVSTSKVTLTGNAVAGGCGTNGGLYVADSATVTATGNTFSDTCNTAILVFGGGTAGTSPTVNLGKSGAPGNNIINGPSSSVGLIISNTANWVYASGNVWHANVQGASGTGTYSAGTGTIPTGIVGGNNYAIGTGSTGLQF